MQKIWIFQGNKKRYDVKNALKEVKNQGGEMHWTVKQHSEDIKVGDFGLIWISGNGDNVGIYALTEIISDVGYMKEHDYEKPFWKDDSDKKEDRKRVKMKLIEPIFVNAPIFKTSLKEYIETKEMKILTSFRCTNSPVTEAEFNKIKALIKEHAKQCK